MRKEIEAREQACLLYLITELNTLIELCKWEDLTDLESYCVLMK